MTVNTKYNELSIKRDVIPETVPSSVAPDISDIEQAVGETIGDKGTVVIWMMNRIVWTIYENGHIELNDDASVMDFWQEMRAFNEQGELHLVRCGEGFSGRRIVDKKGTAGWEHGYVDSISPIWGEKIRYENGRVRLEDADRKLRMDIPVSDGSAVKYGLATRSYIKADAKAGLSGYGDYRFLAVEGMEV